MTNTTRGTEQVWRYGLVEGGHDADPDPERAGRVRVRDISRHGKLVKTEHLTWSQMPNPSGSMGQNETNRPADPGQIVLMAVPRGGGTTGQGHPLALPVPIENGAGALDSNSSVGKQTKLKINLPPKLQQAMENNKLIYKVINSGGMYSRGVADGFPGHIATKMLTQNPVTEWKNIPTAVEKGTNVMTGSMLGGLPGQLSSMFSMLSSMGGGGGGGSGGGNSTNNQKALQNAALLVSQVDESAGVSIGVNAQKRVGTAAADAGNYKTYGELEDAATSRMQGDHGNSTLGDATVDIEGAYGTVKLKVKPDGSVEEQSSSSITSAIQSFLSTLTSTIASGDDFLGKNTKMADMISRFSPQAAQQFKQFIEKVSPDKSSTRQRLHKDTSIGHEKITVDKQITDMFGTAMSGFA